MAGRFATCQEIQNGDDSHVGTRAHALACTFCVCSQRGCAVWSSYCNGCMVPSYGSRYSLP